MNFQNKLLLGIGAFVGIMLLVGWVAINEPARMEVFTTQWQGRSIERGAALFLNNCSTCHGTDGLGLAGVAPALKNPMLFLNDNPAKVAKAKVTDLTGQLTALQTAQTEYDDAVKALPDLQSKRDAIADKNSQEYKDADAAFQAADAKIRNYDPKTPEKATDLQKQVDDANKELADLQTAGWDPSRDTRLKEMGWGGSLHDYIKSTLISGRPASKFYWPQPMPTWAQSAGGPLRNDEIDNLVDYVLNYQTDAVKLTPTQINQELKIPVVGEVSTENPIFADLGKTVDVKTLDLAGGDAAAGQTAYTNRGCAGCHLNEGGAAYSVAPTQGTYTRIVDVRLKDAPNAGLTPEQYIAESILYPNQYVVPGGTAGLMPQTFGDQLGLTELKNIIAFLESQK
ncbi:MAG: c-type cytochrome [Anaerolineae bacterium]|nr:c-type cytochrome [Anaerolineae bacterium]